MVIFAGVVHPNLSTEPDTSHSSPAKNKSQKNIYYFIPFIITVGSCCYFQSKYITDVHELEAKLESGLLY